MHNFQVPEDARLEKLLEQVFEEQYQPEQAQLTRIHDRLLHTIKRQKPEKILNKTPWWIVLLLAGGITMASWWTGEIWYRNDADNKPPAELKLQTEPKRELDIEQMNIHKQEKADDDLKHQNSSVIYQRESY